jgi:XTP/dITP diphosphohydrolase
MNLIFASNNNGKIIEIQSLISNNILITSLKEAGIFDAIPEPFSTFRENAHAKAEYVFSRTQTDCFAEDSGLVVPALQGEPGVWSARYAGEPTDDTANNNKLLENIKHVTDKSAYYQSVICLLLHGEVYYFEGKCEGTITLEPRGDGGFGYDPLFIPSGSSLTFAELALEEKNKISHRGAAMRKFTAFLNGIDPAS